MFDVQVTDKSAVRALERLERELPGAITRSIHKVALLLGRKTAENIEAFKRFPPGTRRLSRSFLIPHEEGVGRFVLGLGAPVYAAIHEHGGTITPRNGPYLVFKTPDGKWHSVKEVTIRPKHYARDAANQVRPQIQGVVENEIVRIIR